VSLSASRMSLMCSSPEQVSMPLRATSLTSTGGVESGMGSAGLSTGTGISPLASGVPGGVEPGG
jgi:hypothetical protein